MGDDPATRARGLLREEYRRRFGFSPPKEIHLIRQLLTALEEPASRADRIEVEIGDLTCFFHVHHGNN